MKSVILIQAHKNIKQINNLIEVLLNDETIIYISIDAKSTINTNEINPNARIIHPQIDAFWGDFSLVQATLNALEQITKELNTFKHIFYISAQHYPTKPINEIVNFLNKEKNYLCFESIDKNGWNVMYRYQFYFFMKYKITRILSHFLNFFLKTIQVKRKIPNNFKGFGGSAWWILNQDTIRYILKFKNINPFFVSFFKTVYNPDEHFFQTILLNSELKSTINNTNYTYIDWSENKASPKILDETDYQKITQADVLFCRKIDTQFSDKLVEQLNLQIGFKNNY